MQRIKGKAVAEPADMRDELDGRFIDLDDGNASGGDGLQMVVSRAILRDTSMGAESKIPCDAVFNAIDHTPSTSFHLYSGVEFPTQTTQDTSTPWTV